MEREDLPEDVQAQLQKALEARDEAHAPISNYHVGSMIVMNDGTEHEGWNHEDVACAGLIHAEQGAISRVKRASRASGIMRIIVTGGHKDGESEEPIGPCGQCCQVLSEHVRPEDNPELIMAGVKGKVIVCTFRDVFPAPFRPKELAS